METRARAQRITHLIFVATILAAALACGDKKDKTAAAGDAATYTVRGEVKAISKDELTIHHEAIPGFIGRKGKVSPMMSMSMQFGLTDGVSTDGIEVGSRVLFTFSTDFKRSPPLVITAIKALAPSTALELSGH